MLYTVVPPKPGRSECQTLRNPDMVKACRCAGYRRKKKSIPEDVLSEWVCPYYTAYQKTEHWLADAYRQAFDWPVELQSSPSNVSLTPGLPHFTVCSSLKSFPWNYLKCIIFHAFNDINTIWECSVLTYLLFSVVFYQLSAAFSFFFVCY